MDKFEILRQRYIDRCRTQISDIGNLLDRNGALSDENQRPKLIVIVHSLAGSGGTFGFPRISQKAILVEDLLRDSNLGSSEVLNEAIQDLLEELAEAAVGRSG